MAQKVIRIPTINDCYNDFQKLFSLWAEVDRYNCDDNVIFDFSHCGFLRPNAVALLGGLARIIKSRDGSIEFDWNSFQNRAVLASLCRNRFADTFGYSSSGISDHSIPYREDQTCNMNDIMDFLTFNWIGKGWVHVSNLLRDAIAGNIWEIFNNAFEHSGSEIGVFSCGQHFKTKNDLILSVVDFGKGIPENIRNFFRYHIDEKRVLELTGKSCLQWAFTSGNSTITDGVPRGLGLDLLKNFVVINHGKLEVYSNDGYALIDDSGERYKNCDIAFNGTMVHITLRCDEKIYCFKSEA